MYSLADEPGPEEGLSASCDTMDSRRRASTVMRAYTEAGESNKSMGACLSRCAHLELGKGRLPRCVPTASKRVGVKRPVERLRRLGEVHKGHDGAPVCADTVAEKRTSRVGGAPSKEYRTREGPTVTAGTSGTTFHNLQQCCSFLCCNVVVTLYIGGTTWPSATDCSRSDRGLPVRVCLS